MTVKEIAQISGVAYTEYNITERAVWTFVDEEGDAFIIMRRGRVFQAYTKEYVGGGRDGDCETISSKKYQEFKAEGERKYGKYIPGSWLRSPRFIPGTDRDRIDVTDEYGNVNGWLDEEGGHENNWGLPSIPRPIIY